MKNHGLKISWPVLIVSSQLAAQNDKGTRMREIIQLLKEEHDFDTITSHDLDDALEIIRSREDLSALVIDWDMKITKHETALQLMSVMRRRNQNIPILMLTDRTEVDHIPLKVLERINGYLWITADTVEFLAGRIEMHASAYTDKILPVFFKELVRYAREYKYAWHTPGHMGGEGFLRSPCGVAMVKFFGENMFRADLSISVPELGSLLDHQGVVGDAERNSARVFGADMSYYILNGTSSSNQVIWRSQVLKDDIAFVDRNCHKSLNYAMVITDAYPVYMVPRRNKRGIIGPVRLAEFNPERIRQKIAESGLIPPKLKNHSVMMSALTNSTYDGVCYNAVKITGELKKSVANLHFDEAWYAYAGFHPIYHDHFGMAEQNVNAEHPPIFVSQSTHKLLTAFSQASMIHIKNGSHVKINPDEFNESYMMHGSTSPQYNMIASLDVATKMMDDNGGIMMHDTIEEAIQLRKKTISIRREILAKNSDDWFFGLWQPDKVDVNGKRINFEEVDTDYLASHQQAWVLRANDPWHGFEDMEDDYALLDPIKLTFITPGIDDEGQMDDDGIPASIVTDYLMDKGIVCEKSDYYSFLLLNSLGTTKGKQGTLLSELLRFKKLYDHNMSLSEVFPDLVSEYPQDYSGIGLKEHCKVIHHYTKEHKILELMQQAFTIIPEPAMKPADAYHQVVAKNVEYVELADMMGRIPAVMIVPYPPGIPIMMGGELLSEKASAIFNYLMLRQDFENAFPGHESDIHGVERTEKDGRKYFKILCVKS